MRLRGAIRRVRYLSIISIWSAVNRLVYRWWQRQQQQPTKHIKIDDEEQQRPDRTKSNQIDVRRPLLTTMSILYILGLAVFLLLLLLTSIGFIVYKPPRFLINYLQWKFPHVVFHLPLPPTSKILALTIDDAPSSATAEILDLLNFYGAKATFFVIGNQISENSHLLQRMHNEGHEIGVHGWADEPAFKLPLIELETQVKEMDTMLPPNVSGNKWFRPGSGWFNKPMAEALQTLGYRIALGSIYPHDPQIPYPTVNAAHVLSSAYSGGIVIIHDRRPYSVRQLKLILRGLTSTGWQVRSLSQLHNARTSLKDGYRQKDITS